MVDDQHRGFGHRIGKPGQGPEKQQARGRVQVRENLLFQLVLEIHPAIGLIGGCVVVEGHVCGEVERGQINVLLVQHLEEMGGQKGDVQKNENKD